MLNNMPNILMVVTFTLSAHHNYDFWSDCDKSQIYLIIRQCKKKLHW
jgi:hypothetical protein